MQFITALIAGLSEAQGQYQTVAEALQTAIVSLLKDEELQFKRSFYYWAAFISHGFASVKLDVDLLDQVHDRLKNLEERPNCGEDTGSEDTIEEVILTLTRDAYRRLEHREQVLSLEWCRRPFSPCSDE